MTSIELFQKIKRLEQRKRMNEEKVSEQMLKTKYKEPYERLIGEIEAAKEELKMCYLYYCETLNKLMNATLSMDVNSEQWYLEIIEMCRNIYELDHDSVLMELMLGFQYGIGVLDKNDA